MWGIKQALLVMGSTVALIIAALATYFVFAYPSILSVLLFVLVVPVFSILGLGFLRIAQEELLKSKQASVRKSREAAN
jgi:uncharacterized protein YacL